MGYLIPDEPSNGAGALELWDDDKGKTWVARDENGDCWGWVCDGADVDAESGTNMLPLEVPVGGGRETEPPKRGMSFRADIVGMGDAPNCNPTLGGPVEPLAVADNGTTSSQDAVVPLARPLPLPLPKNEVPPVLAPEASTSNSTSIKSLSTDGKVANSSSIIFLLSWIAFCILAVVPGIIDAAKRRSSFIAEAY